MNVTAAESHIMEALWERSPRTTDEIIAEVAPAQNWGEATVKTLINRLLKKGAIRSARTEGKTRYTPVLQRADYVQTESQDLLDRLFGGRLEPLVAHFARHRALKPGELERLKHLIAQIEEEGGDGR